MLDTPGFNCGSLTVLSVDATTTGKIDNIKLANLASQVTLKYMSY